MINILNPDNMYRPTPFWSWNDKLDPEELRRQVREMHAAGQGGFFMHARGGLQTKYMSEEWMECIKACLDEAGKFGMEAYLYDENGWPSGFGDGIVNDMGEEYQLKYIRYEKKALKECGEERTIAYYTCDGKFISREKPQNYQGEILRFYYDVNIFYVDNLDAKVVKEFLNCIYEHYYKNIPEELLKNLRGVFTDEPQLSRDGIAWSFILEEEYRKAFNKDLLSDLPALFFEMENSKEVRIRFWRLVAELFSANFMKQVYDWCSEHNWTFTGHGLIEELCGESITANGDIMTLYRYFHIPGVDHLCRINPSKVAAVQLLSAGHQSGKKQLMSESFALCGWNFNFSGMHWLYQQQLTSGVNFLCPHLSSYTLRGLRKRDYPASLFMHQPWWGDYKVVNDYFSRVGMLLAEGEEKEDLLVVYPVSTLHGIFDGANGDALKGYIDAFKNLAEKLSGMQICYHYADEVYVDEYGSFDGKNIVIGECSYNYVLIPQLDNMSSKMVELLMQFSRNGGKVAKVKNSFADTLTIDGKKASHEVIEWYNNLAVYADEASAAQAIAQDLNGIVKIYQNGKNAENIFSIRRNINNIGDDRGGTFYLIASAEYDNKSDVEILIPASGKYIELIDKEKGTFAEISNAEKVGDYFKLNYNFGAGEGIMLFISDELDKSGNKIILEDTDKLPCRKKLATQMKLLSLGEGNVFTLDRCRYRVDGGEWISDEINVIHPRLVKETKCCDLEIECDFVLEDDFDLTKKLTFVSETPEIFKYSLNGVEFETVDQGYFLDSAFRKIELPSVLRHGVNTISAKCHYYQSPETWAAYKRAMIFESEYNKLTYDTEIENFYLVGDFSVKQSGKREDLPRGAERLEGNFTLGKSLINSEVSVADIVTDGMPFFSGKMQFKSEFELSEAEVSEIRYLRFDGIGANSYRVKLNGEEAGFVYMEKYVVPVEKLLKKGVNILEIEVTTSLRNTLGPHHLEEGESFAVHTLSFSREACSSAWQCPAYNPAYAFVKVGLTNLELV